MRCQIPTLFSVAILTALAGCSSGPPQVPYPAFVQVDAIEDTFMASLPGVRAKQLAGDPQTRRTSNRINLPADWSGTSGGAPGRSLELFVIAGKLDVADITLGPGGYAFLPSGSLGFNLTTIDGAQILYFVNDAVSNAMIRSPIIIDSTLLDWEGTESAGVTGKELLSDPGNGAKTWLLRIASGASPSWESSGVPREGYLVIGTQRYVECVNGKEIQSQYVSGGYFLRPPNTINGGPLSVALSDSIWFLRETSEGAVTSWPDCVVVPVTG